MGSLELTDRQWKTAVYCSSTKNECLDGSTDNESRRAIKESFQGMSKDFRTHDSDRYIIAISWSYSAGIGKTSLDPNTQSIQEFRTNFQSNMCYVEDVYHAPCRHWADQPRVYHKCAAAGGDGNQKLCSKKKKCGSVQEASLCAKCKLHEQMSSGKDTGTWMSVFPNKETKKVVVKIRDGAGRKGTKLRSQPSGFFGWTLDNKW